MEINWFTFFAQIVNFLIVLFLLRWVLYGPIMAAMAEREAKIAARFQEAEELAQQARDEADSYREAQEEIDAARENLLAEAVAVAAERRSALIHTARTEADEMQTRWRAAVQQEKDRFYQELRKRMGDAICRIVRDALEDLANAEMEEAIVAAFLDKIGDLPPSEHWNNGDKDDSSCVIIVRSAFPLSAEMRRQIERVLVNSPAQHDPDRVTESVVEAPADPPIAFLQAPDLICGIEAQFSSRRIAWNLRDYVDSYAEQLNEAIIAGAKTDDLHPAVEEPAADGILPG